MPLHDDGNLCSRRRVLAGLGTIKQEAFKPLSTLWALTRGVTHDMKFIVYSPLLLLSLTMTLYMRGMHWLSVLQSGADQEGSCWRAGEIVSPGIKYKRRRKAYSFMAPHCVSYDIWSSQWTRRSFGGYDFVVNYTLQSLTALS